MKENSSSIAAEAGNTSLGIGSVMSEEVIDTRQLIQDAESKSIPVLALRERVLFPELATPVPIGRAASIALCNDAVESGRLVLAVAQKDAAVENPVGSDLYRMGTLCRVVKMLDLPDGQHTAFLLTLGRAKITRFTRSNPYLMAKVKYEEEYVLPESNKKMKALEEATDEALKQLKALLMPDEKHELDFGMAQLDSFTRRVNFLCQQLPMDIFKRQHLLEISTMADRALALLKAMALQMKYLEMRRDIHLRTQNELTGQQRQHYLEEQMRVIQDELSMGGEDDDIQALAARADEKTWPKEMDEKFNKELRRLERFNPTSPDYAVQYAYLDALLSLPWEKYSTDEFTLDKVEEVLDRDHFGLKEVKDRIIEQVAVLKQRGDVKAGIICLYGPPGVGKTSLGKSIAEAMGREYVRVSFGGLHDEAEIRGHRKTYLGAMPGRIITGLQKCKTSNPVFVLDEIDKIGADYKGDPAMALLEVLDPEQNEHFHDNYIDVDYDLSKVLFIATANSLSTVSPPLLDRMELIEITGYIAEEKVQIAERHLVAKKLEEAGLQKDDIKFEPEAIRRIIDEYTRESGVRQLDKKLAKIIRKIVRLKVSGKPYPKVVTADIVPEYLGKREVFADEYENNDTYGVVTGLAWTSAGGEILFIESSLSPGKGERLTLTGNLGDVMKESATIALQYLKAHAEELGIDGKKFTEYDVHIHVPEGAIPKDGPSAGVTMVTSLASSFTHHKVRARLAMTGEITLRGKVIPVGGVKEKILAAKRAGITDIMLCERNRRDIEEIDPMYVEGLTFHYVDTIRDVLDFALLPAES